MSPDRWYMTSRELAREGVCLRDKDLAARACQVCNVPT